MSFDPTIAVLYAQTTYAARFVHDAAVSPQTGSTMSKLIAEEMVKQEQQQVQKSEQSGEVQVGKDGGGSQGHQFGSRRKNRQLVPASDEESAPSRDTPLVGNLLNVKV